MQQHKEGFVTHRQEMQRDGFFASEVAVKMRASIHGQYTVDGEAPAPTIFTTHDTFSAPAHFEAWKAAGPSVLQQEASLRKPSTFSHPPRQTSLSSAGNSAEASTSDITGPSCITGLIGEKYESYGSEGGAAEDFQLAAATICHIRGTHMYFGRDNSCDLNKIELAHLLTMFKTEVLCLKLLQDITGDKLWEDPASTNMRAVPQLFESVEEYVSVFETLLLEECRTQLRGNWKKLIAGGAPCASTVEDFLLSIDGLYVDKKGWLVLLLTPARWGRRMESFKNGDIVVMQIEEIGLGRKRKRWHSNRDSITEELTVGIIRRFPRGDFSTHKNRLLLYVYTGNDSKAMDKWSMFKGCLSKQVTCSLLVLGTIVTAKREYAALHAFQSLHSKMRNAILKPSLELFHQSKCWSLAKPLCLAEPFLEYIYNSFNETQSNAIMWAASYAVGGKPTEKNYQDIWPFTIIQGPPGTGKSHTLWGILNVIHVALDHGYRLAFMQSFIADVLKLNENAGSGSTWDSKFKIVMNHLKEGKSKSLCQKPRILVCAPSNAATDELLTRVVDRGFLDGEMRVYKPKCIRVGLTHSNDAAHALSVEDKAHQLLKLHQGDVEGRLGQHQTEREFLDLQIEGLQKELRVDLLFDKDVVLSQNQALDSKFQQLILTVMKRNQVLAEIKRLSIVCDRYRGVQFSLKKAKAKLEKSFAKEAEIVFTTLSSSKSPIIQLVTHKFDVLVVDEAAQASEVATLPSLTLGASHCILVGDPKQLPATVISCTAQALGYSQSLFERLQLAGCPTLALSEQYRMHPQIRQFPSCHFYQGLLRDNISVSSLADEVYHKNPLLRPYLFFDITYGSESQIGGSGSLQNLMEAKFAASLYEHLLEVLNEERSRSNMVSVGVITPYKLQLECLKQEFGSLKSGGSHVYFNTVDAFQGQERDVIIMSCVRAGNYGVGFVADVRRMNVALTRARRSLWVVGNARALATSRDWAALIADAKERNCFISVTNSNFDNLLASMESETGEVCFPYARRHQSKFVSMYNFMNKKGSIRAMAIPAIGHQSHLVNRFGISFDANAVFKRQGPRVDNMRNIRGWAGW